MSPMRLRAALIGASLFLATSPSFANGRFPLSQRLFQDQGNPDRLFLSATFGLLLTQDGGQNWYHVCEGALTPDLLESDIVVDLMPDGAMLAALVRPLRLSADCGCTWDPVLGDAMDQLVVDVAKAGGSSVFALMRSVGPPIAYRIERSNDDGRTWSKVSDLPQRLQAFTLDVAPSDPTRVYVSVTLNPDADAGIPLSMPALFVSEDAAATWSAPRPIQGTTAGDQPYIAAVHPTNADTVYVRTDAWTANEDTGLDEADDALFVTDDAGLTSREVLRKGGKLFGFALSPDATEIVVGYGDPAQAAREVYPEDLGIYRASTTSLTFTQLLNESVSCLTWNANGLFSCFTDMVGLSPDGSVPPMASGFTPVLTFKDVRGPLACNSETCLPEWQEGREDIASVCDRLSAECEVDTTSNVISCTPPTGGSGGAGGSDTGGAGGSSGAATGGSPGGAATTGGVGATTPTGGSSSGGTTSGTTSSGGGAGEPSPKGNDDPSGCGCRSPRAAGPRGTALALALLALLGLHRRKRSEKR
jgi:MYXO-CTERM domain-containing protein